MTEEQTKPIVRDHETDADSGIDGDLDTLGIETDNEIDTVDDYDLFGRSTLYGKSTESYRSEWKKPSSQKLTFEVSEKQIRDFDSNDSGDDSQDDQSPIDKRKVHPAPGKSCLSMDVDLATILIRERRTKKILMLLCMCLTLTSITLLFNPKSRFLVMDSEIPFSSSAYIRADGDYDIEGEDSYSVLDSSKIESDFGGSAAQDFVNEIGGGDYPLDPSHTGDNSIPIVSQDSGIQQNGELQGDSSETPGFAPGIEEEGFIEESITLRLQSPDDHLGIEIFNAELDGKSVVAIDSVVKATNPNLKKGMILKGYTSADMLLERIGNGPYPIDLEFVTLAGGDALFETNNLIDSTTNDLPQDQSGQQFTNGNTQDLFGFGSGEMGDEKGLLNDNDPNLGSSELYEGGQNSPIVPFSIESRFRKLNEQQIRDDLPFLWFIPRSSSNVVQDTLMHCYGLVGATELGGSEQNTDHKDISTFTGNDGRQYVNVDLSSEEGIQSAVARSFVQSNLADVAISSLITEASGIFDDRSDNNNNNGKKQLGRCFTVLRNPVDRAVSIFHYLQSTTEEWRDAPIDAYAKSIECESNWMVRELNGKRNGGVLNPQDLQRAKDFIRDYCVIGLEDQLRESIERFDRAFGWHSTDFDPDNGSSDCVDHILRNAVVDIPSFEPYGEDSYAYNLLLDNNLYDMDLYRYATQLFQERG